MTVPALNDGVPVPNILIAVMGATGTGKSTLIKTLTGDENIHIGHGQESQTDQVQVSTYFNSDNNCFVTLVDTPGFDDSRDGVSDTDILRKIVDFLQKNGGQTLTGLIYMHRISDPRMGGISKRNLRMFRQLCGDGTLKNLSIATTNWDRVTSEEGNKRDLELRESPNIFEPLITEGAQLVRHDKGIISASSIINYLVHKDPAKLQIQVELDAGPGTTLEDTSAGAELRKEIVTLKAKYEAELLALKEEMKAVRETQTKLLAELQEERRKMEAQRKKMEKDLETLKQAQSDQEKEEEERIRKARIQAELDIKAQRAKEQEERIRKVQLATKLQNDLKERRKEAEEEERRRKATSGSSCTIC